MSEERKCACGHAETEHAQGIGMWPCQMRGCGCIGWHMPVTPATCEYCVNGWYWYADEYHKCHSCDAWKDTPTPARSEAWWLERVDREGDSEVGAGGPARSEEAGGDLRAIAKLLHLEHDNHPQAPYFLPADPGPVECDTIADAVREFVEMADREDAATRKEIASLRQQLAAAREEGGRAKARLSWVLENGAIISARFPDCYMVRVGSEAIVAPTIDEAVDRFLAARSEPSAPCPRTAPGSTMGDGDSTATSPENEKSAPRERSTQTLAIIEDSDAAD